MPITPEPGAAPRRVLLCPVHVPPHPHGAINKTHISRSPASALACHCSLLEVGVSGGGGGRRWLSTRELIAWSPASSHRERSTAATMTQFPQGGEVMSQKCPHGTPGTPLSWWGLSPEPPIMATPHHRTTFPLIPIQPLIKVHSN